MDEPTLDAVRIFHPWMKTSLDMTLEIAGLWGVPTEIYVMDDVNAAEMEEIRLALIEQINENRDWELVVEEYVDENDDDDEKWCVVMNQIYDDDEDAPSRKKVEPLRQTIRIHYYYDIDPNDGYWPDAIEDINVVINSRQYFDADNELIDLVKERIQRKADLYVAKDLLNTWEEPVISPDAQVDNDEDKNIYDDLLFREAELSDGKEVQPAIYALGNIGAYI